MKATWYLQGGSAVHRDRKHTAAASHQQRDGCLHDDRRRAQLSHAALPDRQPGAQGSAVLGTLAGAHHRWSAIYGLGVVDRAFYIRAGLEPDEYWLDSLDHSAYFNNRLWIGVDPGKPFAADTRSLDDHFLPHDGAVYPVRGQFSGGDIIQAAAGGRLRSAVDPRHLCGAPGDGRGGVEHDQFSGVGRAADRTGVRLYWIPALYLV